MQGRVSKRIERATCCQGLVAATVVMPLGSRGNNSSNMFHS